MAQHRPSRRSPRKPLPPAAATAPRPGRIEPLLLDGVAHHRAGRLDAAAARYRAVLDADPGHADALHLLAAIAHQQGEHAAAVDLAKRAVAAAPDSAVYRNTLGVALLGAGEAAAAAAAFRVALARQPGYAEALNNLGNALVRLKRLDDAVAAYRQVLAARPGDLRAQTNLAAAQRELGALVAAEAGCRAVLAADAGSVSAWTNLGRTLHDQGRYGEALEAFDRALAMAPGHTDARANRAMLLLTLGRFQDGWRDYEARWQVDGFTAPRRGFNSPAWDGRPLAGRTLLLHAEQGLGSAIQFARYAPLIARHYGGAVILEAQPPLRRLFATLTGVGEAVVIIDRGAESPGFHVHAPLLSAPGLTGTDAATIPAEVPYLAADPGDLARWRQRLGASGGGNLKVGVVWSGNPGHGNDRNRSMPAAALTPLTGIPGVQLYSLQVGAAAAAVAAWPAGRIIDLAADLDDFATTAAVIANLDLVISVDTAVAHLAGALAGPGWLLLPFVPEWRWQLDRDDSPWYPTLRLFRQSAPGDWTGVIERVAAALAALADAAREPRR